MQRKATDIPGAIGARPARRAPLWVALRARLGAAKAISPAGLASRAAFIVLAYLVLHLAGLRGYTSFLSGTAPTGDPQATLPLVLGVVYVLVYLAFALVAPALLIAAGVFQGLLFALEKRRRSPASSVDPGPGVPPATGPSEAPCPTVTDGAPPSADA